MYHAHYLVQLIEQIYHLEQSLQMQVAQLEPSLLNHFHFRKALYVFLKLYLAFKYMEIFRICKHSIINFFKMILLRNPYHHFVKVLAMTQVFPYLDYPFYLIYQFCLEQHAFLLNFIHYVFHLFLRNNAVFN